MFLDIIQVVLCIVSENIFPQAILLKSAVHYTRILRKQAAFRGTINGLPEKRRLINKRRYFKLMMRHYPNLGSATDWLRIIARETGCVFFKTTRHVRDCTPTRNGTSEITGGGGESIVTCLNYIL